MIKRFTVCGNVEVFFLQDSQILEFLTCVSIFHPGDYCMRTHAKAKGLYLIAHIAFAMPSDISMDLVKNRLLDKFVCDTWCKLVLI